MVELSSKVGKKGHILIPKIFRKKYGIQEGKSVKMEPTTEGILIKGRPTPDEVIAKLKEHVEKIKKNGTKGPRLGALRKTYLEMEFEEKKV